MSSNHSQSAFTIVEIMVVVAIIGILSSFAIPRYLRYRADSATSACRANLRLIETAVENYKTTHDMEMPESIISLVGANNYIKYEPKCPGGGVYSLSPTSDIVVSCSLAEKGHLWSPEDTNP